MITTMKIRNKYVYLSVGILILSIFGLFYYEKLFNIQVINDEFGYWGIGAFLAGYDWSGLMQSTPYYSYGYSLILSLFYKFFQDPIQMYHAAIIFNVILWCASYIIAHKCWKLLFKKDSNKASYIIPLVIVLYSNTFCQTQLGWGETLLYFVYWIIFYLVLLISKSEKKSNSILYCIFLLLASIYMYTIHQRSLGVLIAAVLFVVFILFRLCQSKRSDFLIPFIFIFLVALLFWSTGEIKNYLKDALWINGELSEANDYSAMFEKASGLFSFIGIRTIIESLFGKIFYVLNATLFLGGFAFFYLAKGCFCFIKNKFSIRHSYYVFSTLSILLTLGIDAYAMQGNARLDVPIYGRYFEMVIGPLLLMGVGYLICIDKTALKEFFFLIILSLLGLLAVNDLYSLTNTMSFNGYCAAGLYSFFESGFNKDTVAYQIFFTCGFLAFVSLLFWGASKRSSIAIYVPIVVVLFFWLNNSQSMIDNLILDWQTNIRENLSVISETVRKEYTGDDIYIIEENSAYADDYYFKQLQFSLYDYSLRRIKIDDIIEGNYDADAAYLIPQGMELYVELSKDFDIIESSGYLSLLMKN